jgi:hypothetical protein
MMNHQGSVAPLVLIGLVIFLVIGGVFYSLKLRPTVQTVLPQASTAVTSSTSDLIAGWKSYTNTRYNFSLKYPPGYNFEEQYVEVGNNIAWGANILNPNDNKSPYTKDMQEIAAAVRKKQNLTFQQWLDKECPNRTNEEKVQISNLPATKFACPVFSSEDKGWEVIAIDKGSYVYTLSDLGFKQNPLQEQYFNQVVSSFKFSE